MSGFVVGMTRMVLEFIYTEPMCGEEDTRPAFIQVHYMYFATFLFWVTVIFMVVASLFTKRPTDEQVSFDTY